MVHLISYLTFTSSSVIAFGGDNLNPRESYIKSRQYSVSGALHVPHRILDQNDGLFSCNTIEQFILAW